MFAARDEFLTQGASAAPIPAQWIENTSSTTVYGGSQSGSLHGIWFRRSHIALTIPQSVLTSTGQSSGSIQGMRWYVYTGPVYQPLPNYEIGFKNWSGISTNPCATASSGWTVVKPSASESFTTSTYKTFTFSTPFAWSGGDLAISVAWGQCPVNYSSSGNQMYGTTNQTSASGYCWYSWTDAAGTWYITDAAVSTAVFMPRIELYL